MTAFENRCRKGYTTRLNPSHRKSRQYMYIRIDWGGQRVSSVMWFNLISKIVQLSFLAADGIGAFEVSFSRQQNQTLLCSRTKNTLQRPIDRQIYTDKNLHWKSWPEERRKRQMPKEMARRQCLKRRKYSREEEEVEEVREERVVMEPTTMTSTMVPMPCCFSAPSTAPMGARASYILIMETQNRIKLKTD